VESICAERGLSVISDEVFGDFPWPDRTEVIPSWIAARRAPTFVLSGISKLCGLPQMKLGWIVGCGPEGALRELLQGLEWISDLFLSVGTPIQIALPSLLEGRALFQAATRERIGTNLRLVRREKPGVPFTLLEAEAGWSAVLRFEPRTASAGSPSVAEWALKRHDVYIHPGHFYELPREDDVVVSLLTKPATMEEAIGRIRDSWDEAQLVP
jgi:aspartate/methionine/tyrosine aminotransferase